MLQVKQRRIRRLPYTDSLGLHHHCSSCISLGGTASKLCEDSQVKTRQKPFLLTLFHSNSSLPVLSTFNLTTVFFKAPRIHKGTRHWENGEINRKGSLWWQIKKISALHLRTCPGPTRKRTGANLPKSYQVLTHQPGNQRRVAPAAHVLGEGAASQARRLPGRRAASWQYPSVITASDPGCRGEVAQRPLPHTDTRFILPRLFF